MIQIQCPNPSGCSLALSIMAWNDIASLQCSLFSAPEGSVRPEQKGP